MPSTATPLFATPCLGATIAHVEVFATHIRYEQKLWRDITVPVDMIASVERNTYQQGFVILTTTSRRRIICMVHRKHVERLYTAIRNAQQSREGIATTRIPSHKPPVGLPSKNRSETRRRTTAVLNSKRVEHIRRIENLELAAVDLRRDITRLKQHAGIE